MSNLVYLNAKSHICQSDVALFNAALWPDNVGMGTVANTLLLLMRRAGGISENELARRTGVLQSTINRILSGESRDPRVSTLQPLADYFGITVPQLRGEVPLPWVDDDPLRSLLTARQVAMLRLFEGLTEDQQDEVLRALALLV